MWEESGRRGARGEDLEERRRGGGQEGSRGCPSLCHPRSGVSSRHGQSGMKGPRAHNPGCLGARPVAHHSQELAAFLPNGMLVVPRQNGRPNHGKHPQATVQTLDLEADSPTDPGPPSSAPPRSPSTSSSPQAQEKRGLPSPPTQPRPPRPSPTSPTAQPRLGRHTTTPCTSLSQHF